jgi:UDP-N-acetylmuramoyl-L-alanyl-D-glutamate--2,6-diaminopimelate ligase
MSVPAMHTAPTLTLDRLLAGIAAAPPLAITGISSDSRTLAPGYAFFACKGAASHGLDYLEQALDAGVAAIVWDSSSAAEPPEQVPVCMVPVAGLGARLGEIANRWFDAPSHDLRVAGVTGTNGKTTVAFLIAQCLQRLERRCAYLGTLGAGLENPLSGAVMTTPACIELHRDLADFRSQGASHVAMEVSSHALHQRRVDGVQFDAAIFTNLSRDHIDYHGDMQAYGKTKAGLFLDRDVRHRIVNVDSGFGRQLAARCANRGARSVVRVSSERLPSPGPGSRFVCMRATDSHATGSDVAVSSSWGDGAFHLPLAGSFNVSNAALVLAQLLCWQVPFEDACGALSAVSAPPGRMQRVPSVASGPAVYVDYAHTPAGLEVVLESLRLHLRGRLWCVFGCGGDRDRGKRPMMGATVARLADRAVVTSDNPRFEDPAAIIGAVLAGMDDSAVAIEDRAAAIAYAVEEAGDDDIVLIAGKGHEDVQVVGGKRLPFSDYEAARRSLAARQAKRGGSR